MPEIKLTFEWDGKTVHKETEGFVGNECIEKTEFIEKAFGNKTENREMKSEYYQDTEVDNEEENRDFNTY